MTGDQDVRADAAPEDVAALLRERIYGGIACLSTLLLLLRYPGRSRRRGRWCSTSWSRRGRLWAASILADLVAHMAAHGVAPRGAEAARVLRTSGQILEAAVIPLVLLVLAGIGVFRLEGALRAGVWVSVITLGLFASLAARRPSWRTGNAFSSSQR